MDKLRWKVPQICEIEVKMTETAPRPNTGNISKIGAQTDAYTAESGVTGSVITVTGG